VGASRVKGGTCIMPNERVGCPRKKTLVENTASVTIRVPKSQLKAKHPFNARLEDDNHTRP